MGSHRRTPATEMTITASSSAAQNSSGVVTAATMTNPMSIAHEGHAAEPQTNIIQASGRLVRSGAWGLSCS